MATYTTTDAGRQLPQRQNRLRVGGILFLLATIVALLVWANVRAGSFDPRTFVVLALGGLATLYAVARIARESRGLSPTVTVDDDGLTLAGPRPQTLRWSELSDVAAVSDGQEVDGVSFQVGNRWPVSLDFRCFGSAGRELALDLDQRLGPWRERRLAELLEGDSYDPLPHSRVRLLVVVELLLCGLLLGLGGLEILLPALLLGLVTCGLTVGPMFGGWRTLRVSAEGLRRGRHHLAWSDIERLELRFPEGLVAVGEHCRIPVPLNRTGGPAMLELLARQTRQAEVVDVSLGAPASLLRAQSTRLFGLAWPAAGDLSDAAQRQTARAQRLGDVVRAPWLILGMVAMFVLMPLVTLGTDWLEARRLPATDATVVKVEPCPKQAGHRHTTLRYTVDGRTSEEETCRLVEELNVAVGDHTPIFVNPSSPHRYRLPGDPLLPAYQYEFARDMLPFDLGAAACMLLYLLWATWRLRREPKPWRLAGR